jgi:hypothetical protein
MLGVSMFRKHLQGVGNLTRSCYDAAHLPAPCKQDMLGGPEASAHCCCCCRQPLLLACC